MCQFHELRSGYTNWTCVQVEAHSPAVAWYAFFFFTKKLHCVQLFCKKDGICRPAGGGISCRLNDCVSRVSLCFLCYNVLDDTTYAVDVQTVRFTQWKPDSPAAAWFAHGANFCGKA
jgi:hypothetical protein